MTDLTIQIIGLSALLTIYAALAWPYVFAIPEGSTPTPWTPIKPRITRT